MNECNERAEDIKNDIIDLDDMEKLEYLFDLGKKSPGLDKIYKKPENLIRGCQSSLWIVSGFQDDTCVFQMDSDSLIVRGISELVKNIYSNAHPSHILGFDMINFFKETGFYNLISSNRTMGFHSMIKYIRDFASKYNVKLEEIKHGY